MPHLVREVGVCGHDVDLGTGLLELGVVVGGVFDLGRAVEGESGRHKDQHVPLALEGLLGHFDEFALAAAVHKSGGLEGLNLGVDQGHGVSLRRVEKNPGLYFGVYLRGFSLECSNHSLKLSGSLIDSTDWVDSKSCALHYINSNASHSHL